MRQVNLHVGTVVVKYVAVQCEAALEQWRLRARECNGARYGCAVSCGSAK